MVDAKSLSKAEQTYLHIIRRLQDKSNFGKTLFFKILYFSDFDYYERNGKSITNDNYRHIPRGPAPSNFDSIIRKLKEKGFIVEKHVQKGETKQIRYHISFEISLENDFESKLSNDEVKELDRNMNRLMGMTAGQVSGYSHEDMPVKATPKGEIIDYELVHYRNPIYSVSGSKGT